MPRRVRILVSEDKPWRKPVYFWVPSDPVKVVIAFTSPDKKSRLKALQAIVERRLTRKHAQH